MYFGINGGYGVAPTDTVDTITGNSAFANGTYPNSVNLDGFVGGGTIGANYQTGQLVLGVEGDWDWTSQSVTKSVSCTGGCVATGRSRINWLATLRGRVGYAVDRVLLYGTAGAAFVNGQDTQTQTVPTRAPAVFFSDTALGWAAGAGVEYAVNRNLSAKLEYLHVSATLSDTVPFPTAHGRRHGKRKGVDIRQHHPSWLELEVLVGGSRSSAHGALAEVWIDAVHVSFRRISGHVGASSDRRS